MLSKSSAIVTWLVQHQPDPPVSIPELQQLQMHLLSDEQHQALAKEVQQQKLLASNSCGCLGVKLFPKMQTDVLKMTVLMSIVAKYANGFTNVGYRSKRS